MKISICLIRLIIHPADINILIMDTSKFHEQMSKTCSRFRLIHTFRSEHEQREEKKWSDIEIESHVHICVCVYVYIPIFIYICHLYSIYRNRQTIKGVNFFGPRSEFVMSGSDCGNIFMWDKNNEAIVQWLPGDDSGVVNCLEGKQFLPLFCFYLLFSSSSSRKFIIILLILFERSSTFSDYRHVRARSWC